MEHLQVSGRRYTVRRATIRDIPALAVLLADDILGADRERADLSAYEQAFAEIDDDPNQFLAVICDEEDLIVATLQLTLIPSLSREGAKRLHIDAVRLTPSARGTGVGTAMFVWAHAYGRRRGATLAQLTSDKQRADAHRFYEHLGYQPTHEGFKLPL
ncbi:GNAT family N-acetyltransferase [Ornithinimicrobium pratense]|uniref:GNAT family N-acetyltransferase n=1 Tax=Ornithinimicrobium pratense TaxID=2593973 RepID=A0A5J6V858_9MICO|nr:GNAT family N-acetyltransferase [Ornithinimicrobium pratense]QFG69995.1 GNAT family N-acetyltransferase [Ornithinimicrobium pratense]